MSLQWVVVRWRKGRGLWPQHPVLFPSLLHDHCVHHWAQYLLTSRSSCSNSLHCLNFARPVSGRLGQSALSKQDHPACMLGWKVSMPLRSATSALTVCRQGTMQTCGVCTTSNPHQAIVAAVHRQLNIRAAVEHKSRVLRRSHDDITSTAALQHF